MDRSPSNPFFTDHSGTAARPQATRWWWRTRPSRGPGSATPFER